MRSNVSVINVYRNKIQKKKFVVTQILYGDSFKIINKKGSWFKIKINSDGYKGFIKKRKFPPDQKNTHKVYNLYGNLYTKPNIRYLIKKKISFGSKIKVIEKKK